jgi:molybdate transport system regulatory protein
LRLEFAATAPALLIFPATKASLTPIRNRKETTMRYGARNQIPAKVTSVKKGDVMTQVNFSVEVPHAMAAVLTSESVEDLALAPGDTVLLVVKAIPVAPVKE